MVIQRKDTFVDVRKVAGVMSSQEGNDRGGVCRLVGFYMSSTAWVEQHLRFFCALNFSHEQRMMCDFSHLQIAN